MTTFDTYEMLDSWYESIKGEKTLSLQEAKGLVQDIEACDSLKKKEELQEQLLRGTIGVLYKFIKENDLLLLCNTGYVEFGDLIGSLTLAWVDGLGEKISAVGRYSTLFSRDYFESVAEKLGIENFGDSLRLWNCSYLGVLGSYYRDNDNGVEVSPYVDSCFSKDCKDREKKTTFDIIERGYQLYKDFGFVKSSNTALLGLYGMIFTSIVVKEGRYGSDDVFDFTDEVIESVDVDKIILNSPYINKQQKEVLIQRYGFDGNGEKAFIDMEKDYSFGRCRIGQIAAKALKNLKFDKKVLQYRKD